MSSSPTEQTATVQVEMPQMGVSVAEGTIVEWLKRPGDWVEAEETVAMVTTDKVDVEIPSPAAGRLDKILVDPGETVAVGTVLAEIDSGARPGEAHPEEERESKQAPAGDGAASRTEPKPARPEPEPSGAGVAEQPPDERREEEVATNGPDRSRFFSPVVRKIADKHGVDLSQVKGTGVGGRVRKRDLLAYIEEGGAPEPEPAAAPEPTLHIESPYQAEEAAPAHKPAPAAKPAPAVAANGAAAEGVTAERREPMSPMRKQIAEHMLSSRRTSAHCTTIVEADFSRVAARRRELKEGMARRGVPLTYLAFVARATVEALQRHPVLNASVDGDEIVYHEDVNLGIAVALEQGLIVPVIQRAQRLSLEGMAAAIADVATRAREGRLEPDDVHGGTFTITNPGQFGAVLATPIINQPQVAILDLEAVVKRPVVIDDDGRDAIAIKPMTYLCMSWDHRALDGAEAARFLRDLKELLEQWEVER